jgi:hypothetical protein
VVVVRPPLHRAFFPPSGTYGVDAAGLSLITIVVPSRRAQQQWYPSPVPTSLLDFNSIRIGFLGAALQVLAEMPKCDAFFWFFIIIQITLMPAAC